MAIGCYEEPYLPASFKFVSFKAVEATSNHGRRGAEGEFPFGENTAYADLGRRIRTYSITARFDENNHVLQAAALIAACETTGPGVLVHPTRGVILSAAVKSLKVTDKIETDGGVTYVDLEFVEANNWPNGLSLVGQLLGLGLSAIIDASRTAFTEDYTPNNAQSFRQEAVINSAQEQIVAIRSAYAQATVGATNQQARDRILLDLDNLSVDNTMASNTSTMDRGLALGMQAVAISLAGTDKFDVFRVLANGASLTSSFQNPAKDIENAIYSNVRIIAAAYMAQGLLEASELRTGDIFTMLDIIESLLSQEIAIARSVCSNYLYLALTQFRNETIAVLYSKAYNAPSLVSYDFSSRVHPVVAAYSIYNDSKRHRDLEALNIISNSGRIGSPVIAQQAGF